MAVIITALTVNDCCPVMQLRQKFMVQVTLLI